jgi:precorrin-6B methylase 2
VLEQGDGAAAEAQLYAHACRLLTIHESLLRDASRNSAFFNALSRSLTTGATVLDIGSGSGVWAIIAARLGAARVVAIEQEPLLIGLIRSLARENGVADRVEVVQGNSMQVQLELECDLVISETIGHLIFDEQIVQIMIDARRRFLKSGGILIPRAVRLLAAPAHYSGTEKLPAGISGDFSYFESLLLNVPVDLNDKNQIELLGDCRELLQVDLTTVETMPDLSVLRASWGQLETRGVNCFAVWADISLIDGIDVETINTTSWSAIVYRTKPFAQSPGDVEFTLKLTTDTNYWSTTLTGAERHEESSYSPALVGTELLARSRMAGPLFDKLRFGA